MHNYVHVLTAGRRAIEALHVKCAEEVSGCEWEGTVGALETHLATTCKLVMVPCPNECEDKNKFNTYLYRGELTEHLETECLLRDFTCEHCEEKGTYASISEIHDKVCPKKTIPCPNNECTQTMQRQHIKQHLETCESTVVLCKYKNIGCEVEMKRKDIAKHEEEKVHLHMALDTIAKLVQTNSDMVSALQRSHADSNSLWQTKVAEVNGSLQMLKIKVARLEGDSGSKMKPLKELETKMCLNTLKVNLLEANCEKRLSKLEGSDSFTFMISQCERKKTLERVYTSKPFYSSPNGYHMCSRVYMNGDGEARDGYLSVFIEVVQGKFDGQLSWPVVGKVHVTLLNQLEDQGHHAKKMNIRAEDNTYVGSTFGYYKFIPHSELICDYYSHAQYLLDDTLYFRISVETEEANVKPWLNCTQY